MLAESFLLNCGGHGGVGLDEGERHALGHMEMIAFFQHRWHAPNGLAATIDSFILREIMRLRLSPIALALVFAPALLAPRAQTAAIDPALLARAKAGDAAAEVLVGEKYAQGGGIAQDDQQVAAWYRKAAEQGNIAGEIHLAALYRDGGKGFPRDRTQAALWYRKAAEQGDADAQGTLGLLCSMGLGVPQDDVEAYFWLDLAASVKGPNQAQYAANLQNVGTRITADELAAVEERVAQWKAAHTRPHAPRQSP